MTRRKGPRMAGNDADENRYHSAGLGLEICKLSSWHFLNRRKLPAGRTPGRLPDSRLLKLLAASAAPIVAITRLPEPTPLANATLLVTARPFPAPSSPPPGEVLEQLISGMSARRPGFAVLRPAWDRTLAGFPAADAILEYDFAGGRFRSRWFALLRGSLLFLLSVSVPLDGRERETFAEGETMLDSLRLAA